MAGVVVSDGSGSLFKSKDGSMGSTEIGVWCYVFMGTAECIEVGSMGSTEFGIWCSAFVSFAECIEVGTVGSAMFGIWCSVLLRSATSGFWLVVFVGSLVFSCLT